MWWKEFASLIWAKSLSYIFVSLDKTCSHCGRQGEPANLISTFIQTHARQFYSLALTRFLSIIESSTTNVWNAKNAFLSPPSRVIWTLDHMKVMHSSSADQSNTGSRRFYSCRVVCHLRPQSASSVPRVNCWSVFPRVLFYFKGEAPVLFDLDVTSI